MTKISWLDYNETMKKSGKKVTTDDLALMVAKGFDRMDDKFKSVNKSLENIEFRLGKIESNHMQVVKTYFEKNPQLKVKF